MICGESDPIPTWKYQHIFSHCELWIVHLGVGPMLGWRWPIVQHQASIGPLSWWAVNCWRNPHLTVKLTNFNHFNLSKRKHRTSSFRRVVSFLSRGKAKGCICLFVKKADTAFWFCTAEQVWQPLAVCVTAGSWAGFPALSGPKCANRREPGDQQLPLQNNQLSRLVPVRRPGELLWLSNLSDEELFDV